MVNVDLEKELRRQRSKLSFTNEKELLKAFKNLIHSSKSESQQILERIFGSDGQINELDLEKLNIQNIFHLNEIREICISYRLRFLDSSKFLGQIPIEAIEKISTLQKEHNTELAGFKIMAPANMFKLQERDRDPLLFASLGNGYYYLVHKWGNDLSIFRKILVYPFRDFGSLMKSILGLALLITLSVPSEVMMGPLDKSTFNIRIIFFFWLFFAMAGMVSLYGFSRMQNFNRNLWKSKYFS